MLEARATPTPFLPWRTGGVSVGRPARGLHPPRAGGARRAGAGENQELQTNPLRLVALHPGGPDASRPHGTLMELDTLRLHTYVSTDTPHTVAVRRPFSDWLAWCPSCVRAARAHEQFPGATPSRVSKPRHIDTKSHLPRPPPTTAHRETRLVYGLERASTAPHQEVLWVQYGLAKSTSLG